jgi:protein gp37
VKTTLTKIGESWGPFRGCRKVSEACRFCYAEREMKRYPKKWNFKVPSRAADSTFNSPLHHSRKFRLPTLIFVCPWSDFFLPAADVWRADAWRVIRDAKNHIFRICSKRPERINSCLPPDWVTPEHPHGYPNCWIGVSVEQQRWTSRIDLLRNVECVLRWISAEPVLEELDLANHLKARPGEKGSIGWLVTGGESNSKKNWRKSEREWFLSLRDQARKAGIPYLHLQNGGWRKDKRTGAYGGRRLFENGIGRVYNEFPPLPKTISVRRLLQHTRLKPKQTKPQQPQTTTTHAQLAPLATTPIP